jgi:formate dehydrogenase maturation protein FdhE
MTDRREYLHKYAAENYRGSCEKYLGVCRCPECGRKGYASLVRRRNIKTGVTYAHSYLTVLHLHSEHNKTVYNGGCYIGVVQE